MTWLPEGEKSLTKSLAVLTEYRRVTDGRTDGQTDRQTDIGTDILPRHIVCAMHTRRRLTPTR